MLLEVVGTRSRLLSKVLELLDVHDVLGVDAGQERQYIPLEILTISICLHLLFCRILVLPANGLN